MHIQDLLKRALLGGYNVPKQAFKSEVFQADFDETFRLVAADLTSDGIQYSKTITAPAAGSTNSFSILYEADNISPKVTGNLVWAYFLVVVNLVESGPNGDIYWKPQVKDHDGDNWASSVDWQEVTVGASVAADYRLEGEISWIPATNYENLTDNNVLTYLTKVPVDFRVIFYTDHSTETAEGKLKNASQIRLVGKTV